MRRLVIGVILAASATAHAGPLLQVIEPADRTYQFGNVPIGTTTATRVIKVKNNGDANARVIELVSSPLFPHTGPTVPPTLTIAPGAEVTWNVACAPTDGGPTSTFFDIHWCDATCDPIDQLTAISLSCHGGLFTTPRNVSATAFADQTGQVTFTATNRETTPVTITALQTSAPFTASAGTLPKTVAAGASVDITVTYDASAGAADGTLDILAGASIVGRLGVHGTVKSQIQPQFWSFETVPQGVTYTRPIRIRNSSATTRTITGLAFDLADYTVSGGVGTTLAPGASTDALVTLQANTLGLRQGTLTVTFNSGGSDTARFTAGVDGPVYTLASGDSTPTNGWLDFGTIAVSGGAVDKTFTLTSTAAGVVNGCAQFAPPFAIVACPTSLPAGTGVTVTVRVTPTVAGEFFDAGAVNIDTVGAALLASRVNVVANAFTSPTAAVSVGDAVRATTSLATVVVHNHLDTAITLPLAVTGSGFSLVGPASRAFPPGPSDVTISVTPPAAGTFTGSLAIGAIGDPDRVEVPLSATAGAPAVTADVATLDLGAVVLGEVGDGTLSITNQDTARSFTIDRLEVTGTGFTAVMPANSTLAPGETIAVTVRFSPGAAGAASGQLVVYLANDATPIATVQLAGLGVEEEDEGGGGCCNASPLGTSPLLAVIVLGLLRGRRRRRESWSSAATSARSSSDRSR